jgi:hypothetical protein
MTSLRWITRGLLVLAVAGAIAAVPYLWLGPPSAARHYPHDEVARFRPTAGHGLLQFAGEGFLLLLIAYAGRRWLRVRL